MDGGIAVVVLLTIVALYKEFLAVSLDEEFAELRGIPVAFVYVLLLCLIALTVVVMIQVVGVILLIALLTLPPAIGRWFSHHLYSMMIIAALLGAVFTVGGIAISYYSDFPPGPCIVLLAATAYMVGLPLRALGQGSN